MESEMGGFEMGKIGAVIVLYHPNIEELKISLGKLIPQVDSVCLVDNTGIKRTDLLFDPKIEYISIGYNAGIAAAQNVGVKYFAMKSFDYIIFSDQDSIATDNLVRILESSYFALEGAGYRVATVGSTAINVDTKTPYRRKMQPSRYIKGTDIGLSSNVIECDSTRSSITLTAVDVLKEVGGFDEALFIDAVDNEWCWRALALLNLRTYVVEDAHIYHKLGEGDRKLFKISIGISSPFRLYYQFRNYLWLCRRNYVPIYWKRKNLLRYIIKSFYFPLFVSPRLAYIKQIINGILDGLFNSKNDDRTAASLKNATRFRN